MFLHPLMDARLDGTRENVRRLGITGAYDQEQHPTHPPGRPTCRFHDVTSAYSTVRQEASTIPHGMAYGAAGQMAHRLDELLRNVSSSPGSPRIY